MSKYVTIATRGEGVFLLVEADDHDRAHILRDGVLGPMVPRQSALARGYWEHDNTPADRLLEGVKIERGDLLPRHVTHP